MNEYKYVPNYNYSYVFIILIDTICRIPYDEFRMIKRLGLSFALQSIANNNKYKTYSFNQVNLIKKQLTTVNWNLLQQYIFERI